MDEARQWLSPLAIKAMNEVLLPGTTMQLLAAGYCYRLRDVNPVT